MFAFNLCIVYCSAEERRSGLIASPHHQVDGRQGDLPGSASSNPPAITRGGPPVNEASPPPAAAGRITAGWSCRLQQEQKKLESTY
ncbi:MAG: hypothetical protein JRJ12_00690 [Deltaproteobacteria bacterium]|nr:hypothetical protein [Deltaproteobacteria bacterium]MBW2071473.1 hypothetical protein [Deltaproteobacteria bacterium]